MKNSFKQIINGEKPVFIDFHAEWCGPCKSMEPIIKTVATKWKDKARVLKIDIDKNGELATKLAIRGVPTFIIYKAGKQCWRKSGMQTEASISAALEGCIKNNTDGVG